jgi:hypothetical protein
MYHELPDMDISKWPKLEKMPKCNFKSKYGCVPAELNILLGIVPFIIQSCILLYQQWKNWENTRAFRTSEFESADFSEVRVRKFRTLKTLRTRTQRVCMFVCLLPQNVEMLVLVLVFPIR